MLSAAKHLAFSARCEGEILRLRLRMTLRHSLEEEKILIRSAETVLGFEYISLIFHKRSGLRAVGQAVGAAGAFILNHFVHVMDVLHLRMDGAFGADFAAQAAGDAEGFDDFDFHYFASLRPFDSTQDMLCGRKFPILKPTLQVPGSAPAPRGAGENRKLLRSVFDPRA